MLKDFRTYQLAVNFYRRIQTQQLPCHLRDQLIRASSGICLTLAEGSGRRTPKDRCRFYTMALGSIREVQAILDIADLDESFVREMDVIAASAFKLIRSCQ
jgi:four helix bundle protein